MDSLTRVAGRSTGKPDADSPPRRRTVRAHAPPPGLNRRFGCPYQASADTTCSATTLRTRRDEWITESMFAEQAHIARTTYYRIIGPVLDHLAVDGCITTTPGGREYAGPSPVNRRKQGLKRAVLVEGYGFPLEAHLHPATSIS